MKYCNQQKNEKPLNAQRSRQNIPLFPTFSSLALSHPGNAKGNNKCWLLELLAVSCWLAGWLLGW